MAKISWRRPWEVLALRWPDLGWLGWLFVIGGFLVVVYGAIFILSLTVFQIDLANYTPGPDGQSPTSGSAGLVKEAMFDMAKEPLLFWLAFPAVAIGAPLAEEFIFRGQLFAALARSGPGFPAQRFSLQRFGRCPTVHRALASPWASSSVMGIALGGLLIRFGSLWVTLPAMAVWNGLFHPYIFGIFRNEPAHPAGGSGR